jgi:NarL family two-component system response regulator LiaR
MDGPVRVFLTDDHSMVREGLRTFLSLYPEEVTVVGEAGNGREAVELAPKAGPDVILMDLVMPVMDGITAIRKLREAGVTVPILALTTFADDKSIFGALEAGASGYLLKDVAAPELIKAIQAAARGEPQLSPQVTKRVMSRALRPEQEQKAPAPPPATSTAAGELSERELEVLSLIGQGKSNKEIADELVISERTVKSHVSNILTKLDLTDRTQAAIYAVRHGLTTENK